MAENQTTAGHGVRVKVVGAVAGVVGWAGLAVALVLVAHVVLTVGHANPDNGITSTVADWARPLALGFHDLFAPQDPTLAVIVNYGVAALFWLVVRSLVLKLVHRFA
ncbi:hypothetical protein [Umezawaea sp. Da 62-37]|uniref:hypothetical protein n=1 Tax=Umezawaea sp. Da 62-37 TaxID=3075927 RepID=UPI0028F6C164|nr:hypothetical protein [Umezawaea sp. Da 62-37]WNV91662.1 hypothetical protein RM788_26435 [Umezawaea sp. Da 62-37]